MGKTIFRYALGALAMADVIIALMYFIRLPALIAASQLPAEGAKALVSVYVAYSAYSVLAAPAALFVIWRAWHLRAARLLAAFFGLAAFTLNAFALHGLAAGRINGFVPAVQHMLHVSAGLGLAAILRFAVVFAEENSSATVAARSAFLRITQKPAMAWGWGLFIAALFVTDVVRMTPASAGFAVLLTVIPTLLHLRAAYRVADAEQRARLLWMVAAVVAGGAVLVIDVSLIVLYVLARIELPILAWDVWLLVIGLTIGLLLMLAAIFYRGALHPELVIRRSVLLAIAGPLAIFIFAGVEELVTTFILDRLQLNSVWGTWFAAGIVALLIALVRPPLERAGRNRIQ